MARTGLLVSAGTKESKPDRSWTSPNINSTAVHLCLMVVPAGGTETTQPVSQQAECPAALCVARRRSAVRNCGLEQVCHQDREHDAPEQRHRQPFRSALQSALWQGDACLGLGRSRSCRSICANDRDAVADGVCAPSLSASAFCKPWRIK